MLAAECPEPTTTGVPAGVRVAGGAEDVGQGVLDEAGGVRLAVGGQPVGAERAGRAPGAGRVDDGGGEQLGAVGQADDERQVGAAGGAHPVGPGAAHGHHAGSQAQVRRDGGQLRQRLEVLLDQLGAGGQGLVVGGGPAGGVEQPPGGGVDVVAPRAEEGHVTPLPHRRAGGVAGLQHDERQAPLVQVRGGGQADGPGADHHDGVRAGGGAAGRLGRGVRRSAAARALGDGVGPRLRVAAGAGALGRLGGAAARTGGGVLAHGTP
ncbi:hypothetical protein J3R04_002727 [Spirilliplanes yamanashiensis]|nr:hypothetical protein [Spirilliplanes yamanashiensis]